MKKRMRATVVTALVFVALLAWVLVKDRGRVPVKGEAFGADFNTVTSLQIKTPSFTTVLVKDGDQWMLRQPVQGWADKDTVERMAKAMAELKPLGQRTGLDLNDPKWGLTKPILTVTFTYARNKQGTVSLGAQAPGGSEYFARIDDRKELYFVPVSLQSDLSTPADQLRDKKLTHFDKDAVTSIVLQYPDTALSVEKRGTNEKPVWWLTKPYQAKGDEWNCRQVIEKLTSLNADSFAPAAAAGQTYGLDKPMLKATVSTSDGKQYTIVLGAKTMQKGSTLNTAPRSMVYAQLVGRPEVLMLPESQILDLKKTDMDLRDKRLLEVERNDVTNVQVEAGKGVSFAAQRASNGWSLTSPATAPANSSKVDDILWDLAELEAKAFLGEQADLKQYGLAQPVTTFTLTIKGGKTVKIMVGYKKGDGQYYAMTSNGNQVYIISEMLLLDLPRTLEEIKQPAATPGTASPGGAGNVPPLSGRPRPRS